MRPLQHRLHAQDQLARTEGFDDVVIGTQREARDPVFLRRARRDHDHGDVGECLQVLDELFAPDVGEHQVEDDEEGELLRRGGERILSARSRHDPVPCLLEVDRHDPRDLPVILDDEHRADHVLTLPSLRVMKSYVGRAPPGRVLVARRHVAILRRTRTSRGSQRRWRCHVPTSAYASPRRRATTRYCRSSRTCSRLKDSGSSRRST